MKRLLLITLLCSVFTVNAQLREAVANSVWQGEGGLRSLDEFDNKIFFSSSSNQASYRAIIMADGMVGNILSLRETNSNRSLWNTNNTVNFYEYNSEWYFEAFEYAYNLPVTMKIYKLPSSSTRYADIVFNLTGVTGSTASRFLEPVHLNDKLVFSPLSVTGGTGVEPYVIDFSNTANNGLLLDIENGTGSSDPSYFTVVNNKIIFAATDTANGRELWETDGTSGGTQLFANINFGNGSSDPDEFTVLGSSMLFAATNAVTGRELFITDGTVSGTTMVKNINVGNPDSNPSNLKTIGSEVYFSADDGINGQEFWKSDGTDIGTILVKDINTTGNSNPNNFVQLGSDVFFTADDGVNGIELWKTDGTGTGTLLVKDINSSGDSNPRLLTEYNGKIYFIAADDTNIENLWVSDGTSLGTMVITSAQSNGFSLTEDLLVFNNEIYFNYIAPGASGNGTLYAYHDPALSTTDFKLKENTVSLYPNPTNNYFEIESKEILTKVEVYSLQGQLVKSFLPQNRYDISELSNGMYFINIQANGNSISKRLIKQ